MRNSKFDKEFLSSIEGHGNMMVYNTVDADMLEDIHKVLGPVQGDTNNAFFIYSTEDFVWQLEKNLGITEDGTRKPARLRMIDISFTIDERSYYVIACPSTDCSVVVNANQLIPVLDREQYSQMIILKEEQ